jgi:hypothetical protein
MRAVANPRNGGMSIGYEDPTVKYTRLARAPLAETVTFVGG